MGEWVGLCKIDKDGKPRKIVKCSCVVIKVIIIVIALFLLDNGLICWERSGSE